MDPGRTMVELSWNLASGPPRTTIWAETPKLSAVGEKSTQLRSGFHFLTTPKRISTRGVEASEMKMSRKAEIANEATAMKEARRVPNVFWLLGDCFFFFPGSTFCQKQLGGSFKWSRFPVEESSTCFVGSFFVGCKRLEEHEAKHPWHITEPQVLQAECGSVKHGGKVGRADRWSFLGSFCFRAACDPRSPRSGGDLLVGLEVALAIRDANLGSGVGG